MKQIPLKVVEMLIDDKPVKIAYRAQLKAIIETPANQQTASLDEVRRSIRILDVLERSDGVLELEDADFDFMREKVLGARWPLINRQVLDFVDDVTNPA